jgi:hypothetical protein
VSESAGDEIFMEKIWDGDKLRLNERRIHLVFAGIFFYLTLFRRHFVVIVKL